MVLSERESLRSAQMILEMFLQALAKARNSLIQVSKEFITLLTQAAISAPESAPESSNKDLMLLKIANNLGIVTLGKTREQLTEAINFRVEN